MSKKKVCLITGVGPGTGAALVRRFAEAYEVAMVARTEERLTKLESEIEGDDVAPQLERLHRHGVHPVEPSAAGARDQGIARQRCGSVVRRGEDRRGRSRRS